MKMSSKWNLLRLFTSVPVWLILLTLEIPLILLGWVVIPPAAYFGLYEKRMSKFWPYVITAWAPKWMYLFGNEESGIIDGKAFYDAGADWKQIIYWTALRNPICNIRFIKPPSVLIDPKKVRWVGSYDIDQIRNYDTPVPQWWFDWTDLYCSSFWWQFNFKGTLYRFWVGHQLYPTDIFGTAGYRQFGACFEIQFKRVQK